MASIPSRYRLPWLLLAFAPWYAKHLVAAPYRHPGPVHLGQRHRSALYDGVMNVMLNGYSALSGRHLPPAAGTMAVLFTRIAFAFDDEYERRRPAGETVGFDEVFGAPAVQERVAAWRAYMGAHPAYPSIREYLETFVRKLYSEYVATRPSGFADLVRAAELDSGGLLVAVVTIVALAQQADVSSEVTEAFVALGVLGKLVDDLTDLRGDRSGGRANLLDALVQPAERTVVEQAVSSRERMSTVWWRRHCPATYARYEAVCSVQYGRLRSRWLRFAAGLLWVPALLGRSIVNDRRGRI